MNVDDRTVLKHRGVRVDLSHLSPLEVSARLREAQHWIDRGQRPPILTVRADGVDVSEQPELWPALYRDYRGLGRLEWVGSSL